MVMVIGGVWPRPHQRARHARYTPRRLGSLVWRTLHSLLLLWLVTVVVFGLLHLTPGDPATLMLGEQATPEQIRDLRHARGLDEPLVTQYAPFRGQAVRGDFGLPTGPQRPALEGVLGRLP